MGNKVRITLLGAHLPPAGGREEFIRLAVEHVDRDLFDLRVLFYDRNPANTGGVWHKAHGDLVKVVQDSAQFEKAWTEWGGTDILQSHIDPAPEFRKVWCASKIQVIHNLHKATREDRSHLDELVCVSKWVQDNQLPGLPSRVIYNGVDDSIFGQSKSVQDLRAALSIPKNAVVVGWVGFVTPVKQLELFLAVASKLLVRYPRLYFLLVGGVPAWGSAEDKKYFEQIKRALAVIPENKRIFLLGEKYGQDLADAYDAMNVYLQLSKFETFSRTVAEAMMQQNVCVVSQGSGMSELIGTHGFTVDGATDAAQVLEHLIQNPDLRKEMAVAARTRALDHFAVSKQCVEYEKMWLTIARRKKVLPEVFSSYEVRQKLVPQDYLKRVLVLAPTNQPTDFSAYLTRSAQALGLKTFDVLTYREFSTTDPVQKAVEFGKFQTKIKEALKAGNYQIVICLKMMNWTSDQVRELHQIAPTARFVLWMTDMTREGAEQFWLKPLVKEVDLFFATGRGLVRRYAEQGIPAHWATEGFCEECFKPVEVDKQVDIGYVGNFNAQGEWPNGFHLGWQYPERHHFLRELYWKLKARYKVEFRGGRDTPTLPSGEGVWNKDFAAFVGRCKIMLACVGFSTPSWREEFYTSNRLYLYLGCGGFVMTQYFEGIEEFFVNHRDLVWFHSLEEVFQLIEFYLTQDRVRREIALRGHHKACRRFKMSSELKKVLAAASGRPFFEGYGYSE